LRSEPYNEAKVWECADASKTQECLLYLSGVYISQWTFELEKAKGTADLEIAKRVQLPAQLPDSKPLDAAWGQPLNSLAWLRPQELTQVPKPISKLTPEHHRPGRKLKRDPAFRLLAGRLWREAQKSTGNVCPEALKAIAVQLDASQFQKPSDYLEETAARALKEHNGKFGNSPKKILSWTDLVVRNEPDFKQAMRKLLSRCARTSGN
jgi:hypothetical protein